MIPRIPNILVAEGQFVGQERLENFLNCLRERERDVLRGSVVGQMHSNDR